MRFDEVYFYILLAMLGAALLVWFMRSRVAVVDAFAKTRSAIGGRITADHDALEEALYTADIGARTVADLLTRIQSTDIDGIKRDLRTRMLEMLGTPGSLNLAGSPAVLMVVGVNGAGKTTTIGKLAAQLASQGKRVLVAAGDTFRAAAGEQLRAWTERATVEIFEPSGITDPSAVAYQALELARAKRFHVVIIDTAGRLHTQKNLMEELKKMKRVLAKLDASAPHETLLVLDANSGQNALTQAKEFHAALTVDGVVLTKLDGSAKGGVAIGISNEVGLPIKLIGVGEKLGDLKPFDPVSFVNAILG